MILSMALRSCGGTSAVIGEPSTNDNTNNITKLYKPFILHLEHFRLHVRLKSATGSGDRSSVRCRPYLNPRPSAEFVRTASRNRFSGLKITEDFDNVTDGG